MKIIPPIEAIATELEQWALDDGWKTVALAVAKHYHAQGGGEILPVIDSERELNNAIQRLKRIFRKFKGPRYAPLVNSLKVVTMAALPPERRARLESPGDPVFLATIAAREGIQAVNTVHLGALPASALKEIDGAIAAFTALKMSLPGCGLEVF
nr:hypothetical protein [uncultured Pluralibacter sp.]